MLTDLYSPDQMPDEAMDTPLPAWPYPLPDRPPGRRQARPRTSHRAMAGMRASAPSIVAFAHVRITTSSSARTMSTPRSCAHDWTMSIARPAARGRRALEDHAARSDPAGRRRVAFPELRRARAIPHPGGSRALYAGTRAAASNVEIKPCSGRETDPARSSAAGRCASCGVAPGAALLPSVPGTGAGRRPCGRAETAARALLVDQVSHGPGATGWWQH